MHVGFLAQNYEAAVWDAGSVTNHPQNADSFGIVMGRSCKAECDGEGTAGMSLGVPSVDCAECCPDLGENSCSQGLSRAALEHMLTYVSSECFKLNASGSALLRMFGFKPALCVSHWVLSCLAELTVFFMAFSPVAGPPH